MIHPKDISIQDYRYTLPEERIAKYPLAERDASKLLVYEDGLITSDVYRNIASYIPPDSLLIFNDTKVVEARLLFQKPSGGVIEIFCLEPHAQYADITSAMLQKQKVWWHCLLGGASKWKPGQVLERNIEYNVTNICLQARFIEKMPGSFIVELSWQPASFSFADILHAAGAVPLPPYIKRKAEASDKERYQTIYARHDGSVAAPTAGLHFTDRIFNDLDSKNVQRDYVTLHVGAGTFKPVKSAIMLDHDMHAEWIEVSRSLIENILKAGENKIIAVGTTSLRTLESLYWLGVKLLRGNAVQEPGAGNLLYLSQWEAYEMKNDEVEIKEALQALLDWMNKQNTRRLIAKTQILIAPGYQFKMVSGLITNFHQPQSTLLLLIASFIGNSLPAVANVREAGWKKVYAYALEHDFRFLSYGDGCLLWKNEN